MFGGAGQIGLHLVRYFHSLPGSEAVALCRSSLVTAGLRHQDLPVKAYNPADESSIRAALDGCQVVIDSTFTPMPSLRTTDEQSRFYKVVATTPGLRQLIHFSSVAVYGELSGDPVRFDKPEPDTIYGAQKLATERLVRSIGRKAGVPTMIARLGHVYGAEMAWSLDFVTRLRSGTVPVEHFAKVSNAVHVRQICQAMRIAMQECQAGTCNLIGSPNLTWAEIFNWHREALLAIGERFAEQPLFYRSYAQRCGRSRKAFWRDALNAIKGGLRSGIASSPRTLHAIKILLSSARGAPSVQAVRNSVGSPGLEAYFASTVGGGADLVFDSLDLGADNSPATGPVTVQDRRELEQWLRTTSDPSAVLDHLNEVFSSERYGWAGSYEATDVPELQVYR